MIYEYIFSLGVYVAAPVEPGQGQTNSEIVSQPTTASGMVACVDDVRPGPVKTVALTEVRSSTNLGRGHQAA